MQDSGLSRVSFQKDRSHMGVYVIDSGRCELINSDHQYTFEITRGDLFGDSYVFKQIVSPCLILIEH